MFQELLEALAQEPEARNITYMLIGGQAVLLYGVPRLTEDVDVTLDAGPEALAEVLQAVERLGWEVLVKDAAAFVKKTLVLPCQHPGTGIRIALIFSIAEYRRKYETPVAKLRETYRDLPGLINRITDDVHKIYPALREFETFNSTGRIFDNVPVDQGSLIVSLLTDYAGLFSSFVKESRACEVLKRDDIRKEAGDTLGRFMMMMSRFDFSEDMPKQPKRTA